MRVNQLREVPLDCLATDDDTEESVYTGKESRRDGTPTSVTTFYVSTTLPTI